MELLSIGRGLIVQPSSTMLGDERRVQMNFFSSSFCYPFSPSSPCPPSFSSFSAWSSYPYSLYPLLFDFSSIFHPYLLPLHHSSNWGGCRIFEKGSLRYRPTPQKGGGGSGWGPALGPVLKNPHIYSGLKGGPDPLNFPSPTICVNLEGSLYIGPILPNKTAWTITKVVKKFPAQIFFSPVYCMVWCHGP